MAVSQNRRAVGVFPTRSDAERALHELRDSGFPMDKVSVVVRDADRDREIAGAEVSDRVDDTDNKSGLGATKGALTGGALGGLTGLLVGLGALAIPGIGPVMLAGAAATTIATTLSGTAIGATAGGLLGALVGLGVPEDRARVYNERVSRGEYLVIVDGTNDEIAKAQTILDRGGIQEFGVYDYDGPAVAAVPADYAGTTPSYAATATPGMTTGRRRRAIGVFAHRRDAEAALGELRNSGFPMDRVSVIAKHADGGETIAGADVSDRVGTKTGNQAGEGAATGAATGGALGGLGGLLVGLGALAIPGIGPVIAGGATATALATALTGGAIGAAAGGLGGALVGLGIPDDRAKVYNDRVSRGDYLVFVDGTDEEIARAQAIFSRYGIQEWGIFDSNDDDATRRDRVDTTGTTSNYVAPSTTPVVDTTGSDVRTVSSHPEVTIVDRRDETL